MHKIITQYGSNHLGRPVPVRFSPAVLSLFMECVVKEIPLTQGQVTLVDDEDFERFGQYRWFAHKQRGTYYAARNKPDGDSRAIASLHREILQPGIGQECDHINGNALDNRRCNLRVCTRAENSRNAKAQRGTSSVFKGVRWHPQRQRWYAEIRFEGIARYLGRFHKEEDAARAYDHAARELFGEFAWLNCDHWQLATDS